MPKPNPKANTQKTAKVTEAPKAEKTKKAAKAQPKVVEDEELVDEELNEQGIDQEFQEDDQIEGDGEFNNFDEDEDDDDDEVIGDDDIYIPKKKSKVSQTREKVTKGAERTTEAGAAKKSKSQDKTKTKAAKTDETDGQIEKVKKTKADRFSKKDKDVDASHRGILLVSHLPYGFIEEGLKEYFAAYGDILNINLARSKTTGRPKGYAFIEFRFKEVAKVAAESMNGYLVYGKKLECKVIDDDEGVKVKTKKLKYIPYNKIFIEQKNKDKKPSEVAKEVKSLLKNEEKKRQIFKDKGIDYDFPGFSAVLSQVTEAK